MECTPTAQALFCQSSHSVLLWVLLHPLQEAVSALRVLNVLNPHTDLLGQNLALNWLVYNDAQGMLADLVDSSGLPW